MPMMAVKNGLMIIQDHKYSNILWTPPAAVVQCVYYYLCRWQPIAFSVFRVRDRVLLELCFKNEEILNGNVEKHEQLMCVPIYFSKLFMMRKMFMWLNDAVDCEQLKIADVTGVNQGIA